MTGDGDYSVNRETLHTQFLTQYEKQNINYRKFYLASDYLHKRAKRIDIALVIVGGLLLFVLSSIVSGLTRGQSESSPALLVSLVLSALVTALSIIDMSEDWGGLAKEYHNCGRAHQHLFSEFDYVIRTQFPDQENVDIDSLKSEYERLMAEKNRLNTASPQITNKWYHKLQNEIDIDEETDIGKVPNRSEESDSMESQATRRWPMLKRGRMTDLFARMIGK